MDKKLPHRELVKSLIGAHDRQRLGHALLIKVLDSHEVTWENEEFSALILSLLCLERKSGAFACGTCDSCKSLEQFERHQDTQLHPDVLCLHPEKDSGYTVDQIRRVNSFLSLKKNLSPNRVIWIQRAEKLYGNQGAAANALLKILEEPRPDTYLILTSKQPELLMATLQSRCHKYVLPRSDLNKTLAIDEWMPLLFWLQKGAPQVETFSVPADKEAYWKEREAALVELQNALGVIWQKLHPEFSRFSSEEANRVLDFFTYSEILIKSIKGYANAPLQWLDFKLNARKGSLWKLSKLYA